jgi:hypothetical protein
MSLDFPRNAYSILSMLISVSDDYHIVIPKFDVETECEC